MARQLELPEIVTAGKFLILTGIILPLLPNEPITPLTRSHALSGVARLGRGVHAVLRELPAAAILGFEPKCIRDRNPRRSLFVNSDYSGAGTACQHQLPLARAQVGIALATAVMYLRILAIIAVFNWSLAARLTPSLLALSLLGFALAGLHDWCAGRPAAQTSVSSAEQPTRALGRSRSSVRGSVRCDLHRVYLGGRPFWRRWPLRHRCHRWGDRYRSLRA